MTKNIPHILGYDRITLMREIKRYLGDVHTAVEVGTHRGAYAGQMCNALEPAKFYAVDPFLLYEDYTDKPCTRDFATQESLDSLAEEMASMIANVNRPRQGELLRLKSQDAVHLFADNSLDVVYIDADHKYDPVYADITAWYKKVKPGGVLCGDDYIEMGFEEFGVIKAVSDFAAQYGLEYAVTSNGNPSWVFVKQATNPFCIPTP
jgi:hypothetical protein